MNSDEEEEEKEEESCWLTWSRRAAGSVSSHEEMAWEIGDSTFGFGGRLGLPWWGSVEVGGGAVDISGALELKDCNKVWVG